MKPKKPVNPMGTATTTVNEPVQSTPVASSTPPMGGSVGMGVAQEPTVVSQAEEKPVAEMPSMGNAPSVMPAVEEPEVPSVATGVSESSSAPVVAPMGSVVDTTTEEASSETPDTPTAGTVTPPDAASDEDDSSSGGMSSL
ncbi:MAG TPA: hypothetical protein VI819_02755 [Patescibacteria group bacterium]|nr:hypothetical protein [Patescibacteria group bacterium]